jgi:CDP-archaeol synthase
MPPVDALLVFLPVLGAPLLHAPVLISDAFPRLRRPLDGGLTVRGRRLFGDNKTWRGAIVMVTGTMLAALALSHWDEYWHALPPEIRALGPLLMGLLVGLGVVVGELPNSFVKRQLDIAPGTRTRSPGGVILAILDQGDLVLGIALLLLPIWRIPLDVLVLAFVAVSVVHAAVGVAGHRIGARQAAW